MSFFKLIELAVILGGLWLLWRSASRVGAQAAEQKAREAEEAAAPPPGSDPDRDAP